MCINHGWVFHLTKCKIFITFRFPRITTRVIILTKRIISTSSTFLIRMQNKTKYMLNYPNWSRTWSMVIMSVSLPMDKLAPVRRSQCKGKWYESLSEDNQEKRGVIPRAVEHMFSEIRNLKEVGWTFKMKIGFQEIYNETIKDLLSNK